MNLNDLIEVEIENGYGDTNAQAKVCQDIILKAIASGKLSRNVTIKGGVSSSVGDFITVTGIATKTGVRAIEVL